MTAMRRSFLLGAIQVAIVLSLAGKLLYDRMTRPRVWVLTQVYDPDLPIRGRYLSERLTLPVEGFAYKPSSQQSGGEWYANRSWAYFEPRNGQLIAKQQGSGSGGWISVHKNNDGSLVAFVEQPVLVFVPEHADIPILKRGQEMWVEVTVPAKGPPRPIPIAIKRDGILTPLQLN
jgi:hypothetical protein